MIYLICQDWSNTSNNHAGMKYLCNELQRRYPDRYKVIVIPDFYNGFPNNRLICKVHMLLAMRKFKKELKAIFKCLSTVLRDDDKVFLMEYMEKLTPQLTLAKKLKKGFPHIPVYGLVHLVPQKLDVSFPDSKVKEWTNSVDYIMTLGSSLTNYFRNRGVAENRLITTFHYVDNDYYRKEFIKTDTEVRVIAMGNQMRNIQLLKSIVAELPQVEFIICQGVGDMRQNFEGYTNVRLIPFVSEGELKAYMDSSDISLNVMHDTVGSNVIVTSMAMGLAMVCSDVGSIHDYCSEENCIFCQNESAESFTNAIMQLVNDSNKLQMMKSNSLKMASKLSINNFAIDFY